MVQKYQSPVRVYKYPFELVMAAYVRRFPTCPMIPIFVHSEIVHESISEDGAVHMVERRCQLNVDAPYLLKKIAGVELVSFIQRNTLDKRARVLKIEAYNESFAPRILINELCSYFVHPENPEWTCFEQSASLEIKSFFGFEGVVEKIAIKQYSANIAKGKEIIDHFIEELKKEGITHVPQWEDNENTDTVGGEKNSDDGGREERKKSLEDSGTATASSSTLEEAPQHSNLIRKRSSSRDRTGSVTSTTSGKMAVPSIRCDTFSEDSEKYRLDGDYIQRYLGKLSPMEESQLVQLRIWVSQLQKGHPPSDATMLRFLRAGEFNIERAREMLSESLNWRKKYQVDKILQEYRMPKVIQDFFPGGWHHTDKDGRPLFLLRLGMMDVKGLMKAVGEEGLLRLALNVCEEGIRLTEEATENAGYPITTWAMLVDLEGLNMRHLWRPGISALLKIIETVADNYPETMGRMLIIRAPRVFPVLWTLVRAFIDERTCSKFFFYGGNDFQGPGGLTDYIENQHIPKFLGGESEVKISEGGLVPKSLYLPIEQLENLNISEESIYKSVVIGRGQIHEVIHVNEDIGSVITWDFDVLKHSVCFTVFRTTHTISSNLLTRTEAIKESSKMSENLDHKSVIEKGWKEDQDFFRVELSTACHDGESVQGSHVTNQKGCYILQWKFMETNPAGGSHHLMDTLSPKAKLMYFVEVLKSADYRGSMSSLHSHHSGFSSLSSRSVVDNGSNNSSTSKAVSSCPSR